MTRAIWSEEDTELLKKTYPITTSNQIKGLFPHFTREQIYRKAKTLGIKKDALIAKESRIQNRIIQRQDMWTDEELKILIEYYPSEGVEGVQEILLERLDKERNHSAIIHQANKYSITREKKNSLHWKAVSLSANTDSEFSVTIKFKGR